MNNDKPGRKLRTFAVAVSAAAVLMVAGIPAGHRLDRGLNLMVFASSTRSKCFCLTPSYPFLVLQP